MTEPSEKAAIAAGWPTVRCRGPKRPKILAPTACPTCGHVPEIQRDWLLLADGARPEIAAIMRACARSGGISVRELSGRQRVRHHVRPRQLAAWLACELRTDLSLVQIGKAFGLDHTTVIHARDKAAAGTGRPAADVWDDLRIGATLDDVWPLRRRTG